MKSFEASLLAKSTASLRRIAENVGAPPADHTYRLAILEAVAAHHAGWSVSDYWTRFGIEHLKMFSTPGDWAPRLLREIAGSGIPVPLALAALAREDLTFGDQRKSGAYYTDFRLAQMLAAESVPQVTASGAWIDPACGTGTLLVAAALETPAGRARDQVIGSQLAGADLSANALRGALLAVASTTTDLDAVQGFHARLLHQDSLRSRSAWRVLAPGGASLVIGNPPWERLRPSRHESVSGSGQKRHYGQSFEIDIDLTRERNELLRYLRSVTGGTSLQGRGEHDYYKLFLELGLSLTADEGMLALLLPAGLIRSQGTELLRREINEVSTELVVSVIENRARHFAIDTRFKFLAVVARLGQGTKQPISLRVADRSGALPSDAVRIAREDLAAVRPDLSLPEVRSDDEWRLYQRLHRIGQRIGDNDGPWRPKYMREVDMTSDRRSFRRIAGTDGIPLVEGRHVAQFRSRAKAYRSGEGRAAIWTAQDLGAGELKAQWFVSPSDLRPATRDRVARSRIGFCDITGQTNERTLLAARIPAEVACGNKVPTLLLPVGGAAREDLFLALANSLPVDWMLRRVVTTTVNFFILDDLPLPAVSEDSPIGIELVDLARRLTGAEGDPDTSRQDVGRMRCRLDALVAYAWEISVDEMRLILRDFPLLDRGQPRLDGEPASTITADSVIAELSHLYDDVSQTATRRVEAATALGAVPYVPAEYV